MRTTRGRPAGWRSAAVVFVIAGLAATDGCQSAHPPKRPIGPIVQSVSTCADFTIAIYFEPGSAAVTREARALLAAVHRRTEGCDVTGVNVIGLADAPGSPDENLGLSKRRARAVTLALARQGLTQVAFQVTAAGDAGAQTRSGQEKPLRRRAVVEFHVMAKTPSTKPSAARR